MYYKKGDYDISDYDEAIKLNPNDAQAYFNRGDTYYEKGDYDSAISDFTEAIRLEPNLVVAQFNRGLAYYGAISDYGEAIRLNPNDAQAYFNRGDTYYKKGDYDKAIPDYNEAIRLNPNLAIAYINRGLAYYGAISDHDEAIRLNPNNAVAYGNRGYVYYEKGDYNRAISDYDETIKLNPNNAVAYGNRGYVYFKKGDYDSAISDYNEAIRLDPNDTLAYYNRGYVYFKKGDYDSAIVDYESALRIDPSNAYARKAIKEISGKSSIRNGVFTDLRDGKRYKTIKIGNQTWMAENLNFEIAGFSRCCMCYEDDPANGEKYGRLYPWEIAKKACPSGWHLPSKDEWEVMTAYIGGANTEGRMLKATSGWYNNGNGEDDYGFSAMPGGFGKFDGCFYYVDIYGYWWSSTEHYSNSAYYRSMYYDHEVASWGNNNKGYLLSVRCVQD